MTTTPSLSNYFSINMDPANPYLRSTIKPYIPSNDQELIKSFERAYQSYSRSFNLDNTGAIFYELKDPLILTFSLLDPKDLAHFSEVSKCCFLATKIPLIWECQLIKHLSNVSITIPNVACSSSHEERFKIMFKRINDERKPYIWQFNRNNEILNELRGPNGMNGTIHKAWQSYEQSIEIESNCRRLSVLRNRGLLSRELFPDLMMLGYIIRQSNNEIRNKHRDYICLDGERIFLAGSNYDGTAETIDPVSQQGRLLNAKNILVPNAFNDPDQYKTIILFSEIFKKAALIPQNGGEQVPDEEFAEESWCFIS